MAVINNNACNRFQTDQHKIANLNADASVTQINGGELDEVRLDVLAAGPAAAGPAHGRHVARGQVDEFARAFTTSQPSTSLCGSTQ